MKLSTPTLPQPSFTELDSLLEKMIDRNEENHFYQTLAKMIRRWPHLFENDLLKLSQHFLALLEYEFKKYRTTRHQLRLLCSFYLMRKNLFRQFHQSPNELLLDVRLLPTYLEFPFSRKHVIGFVLAIHLPTPYERFEERHILNAVQRFFPEVRALQESFLILQKARDPFRLLYLEVNKSTSHSYFSTCEIGLLKRLLKEELKKHVETLSPSVFGFQNAEETLRNILVLSKECTNDLPQAMIFFENSSGKSLTFRVIIVRILNRTSQPIAHYFEESIEKKLFDFIPERSSIVGDTEEGYSKEASVFCLRIPKHPSMLRANSSLNLYQAREYVLSLLEENLGELRDYNGGLFSKQAEAFKQFKDLFKELAEKEPMLLEDFFHSLQPIEMQAIIPLDVLGKLFDLYLQVTAAELPKNESYIFKVHQEASLLFIVIYFRSADFTERLTQELEKSFSKEIEVSSSIKTRRDSVISYIYRSTCPQKQHNFCQTIEHTLETWFAEKKSIQTFRLSLNHLVLSLDPRMGGDLVSSQILKGLFEGLMRMDEEGNPSFAVAESLEISRDGKIYLFKLKDSYWNNGDQVTAYDFQYSWKTTLSPHFTTFFAHLFYPIKNAKNVRNGLASLDELGIHALDALTLSVELEHPCPYFLELTTHPLYSPVHHKIDQIHPNWSLQTGKAYVCNGPFQLKHTTPQEMHELERNPLYWDPKSINLDRIIISRSNARQAVEMFKNNEIDWLGWPSRTWEPSFAQASPERVEKLSMGSSFWCLLNTQQFPFNSAKIRRALSCALDRQAIIDCLSYDGCPAFSPLASSARSKITHNSFKNEEALILFEEGLRELSIEHSQLPELVMIHPNNTLRRNIAIHLAQQWKQVLGIDVKLQCHEFRTAFSKMTKGEYQIGMMGWHPWVDDPFYTLNIFKTSAEEINFSKWEHSEYAHLISQAAQETDLQKKTEALDAAEVILIREAPLIPLFYEKTCFIKNESIICALPKTSVNVDLKYVSLKK